MTKDNGGPAFPFAATDPSNVHMQAPGMSMRDYFAGQALAGYFAYRHAQHMGEAKKGTAEYLWQMADAMLAARASHD